MPTERTIIQASPHLNGTCAHVASAIGYRLFAEYPDEEVNRIDLAGMQISPCIGCDHCRKTQGCYMDDAMAGILRDLDNSREVIVVSPIYFAGPPAHYKAMLDRFQVYYWRGGGKASDNKRPVSLVAVGDGGDPHGYDPLVVCTRSAFSVAGFRLAQVVPCIGFDEQDAARIAVRELFDN